MLNDHCHRVSTQLLSINIIIIITSSAALEALAARICARVVSAQGATHEGTETGAKERNTFCVLYPFPKFLHSARKMKPGLFI
jgi:hypothetical protein